MKYFELDEYEKEVLQAFNSGKLKPIKNMSQELKRYQAIARETLNKTKNINIRLPNRDLQKLKAVAMRKGLPYQTLISSVLHQYSE